MLQYWQKYFKVGRTYEIHTILLPLKTREWRQRIIDTHARVAVSKFYDVTNMWTKKTRAHFLFIPSVNFS